MGIFSTIGSFFGPVGTAVGGVVDYATADKDGGGGDQAARDDYISKSITRKEQFDVEMDRRQYERQKEFAQMGIRWKAADAAAAGIHPVAALGGGGASYSPTVVAGALMDRPEVPQYAKKDRFQDLEKSLADMGQNTKRAERSTMTNAERTMEDLTVRNAALRNELLEVQIANLRQPNNPPAPDAVGSAVAPVGAVEMRPSKSTSADPRDSGREAASTPGFKNYKVGGGLSVDLPGQEMSESLENAGPVAGPVVMTVRGINRLLNGPEQQPAVTAPAGYSWVWKPFSQSWQLEKPRASANWSKTWKSGRGNARSN